MTEAEAIRMGKGTGIGGVGTEREGDGGVEAFRLADSVGRRRMVVRIEGKGGKWPRRTLLVLLIMRS